MGFTSSLWMARRRSSLPYDDRCFEVTEIRDVFSDYGDFCHKNYPEIMTRSEPKPAGDCETGCMNFTGGEKRHTPGCFHYPGSLSNLHDKREAEISRLKDLLGRAMCILEKVVTYSPTEEPSPGACWFCDMGGSGRSIKGDGYHDDDCLTGQSKEYLAEIRRGREG